MSNRSSHLAHRFQTLPSALAGVPGSRRLPAHQPTVAQAQTVEEAWSSTLTPDAFIPRILPGDVGGGV